MIYLKTKAGKEEIKSNRGKLPRSMRNILLCVDGVRDDAALLGMIKANNAPADTLETLLSLGFIVDQSKVQTRRYEDSTILDKEALRKLGLKSGDPVAPKTQAQPDSMLPIDVAELDLGRDSVAEIQEMELSADEAALFGLAPTTAAPTEPKLKLEPMEPKAPKAPVQPEAKPTPAPALAPAREPSLGTLSLVPINDTPAAPARSKAANKGPTPVAQPSPTAHSLRVDNEPIQDTVPGRPDPTPAQAPATRSAEAPAQPQERADEARDTRMHIPGVPDSRLDPMLPPEMQPKHHTMPVRKFLSAKPANPDDFDKDAGPTRIGEEPQGDAAPTSNDARPRHEGGGLLSRLASRIGSVATRVSQSRFGTSVLPSNSSQPVSTQKPISRIDQMPTMQPGDMLKLSSDMTGARIKDVPDATTPAPAMKLSEMPGLGTSSAPTKASTSHTTTTGTQSSSLSSLFSRLATPKPQPLTQADQDAEELARLERLKRLQRARRQQLAMKQSVAELSPEERFNKLYRRMDAVMQQTNFPVMKSYHFRVRMSHARRIEDLSPILHDLRKVLSAKVTPQLLAGIMKTMDKYLEDPAARQA